MSDLFPTAPVKVSIDRQVEAVQRELKLRHRVYARRVAENKMTQAQADIEIAVMSEVAISLMNVGTFKLALQQIAAIPESATDGQVNGARVIAMTALRLGDN